MSGTWRAVGIGAHRLTHGITLWAANAEAHLTLTMVAGLVLFAAACIAYTGVFVLTRPRSELEAILQPYRLVPRATDDRPAVPVGAPRSILRRVGGSLVGLIEARGKRPALERQLVRANLPVDAGEFLAIAVIVFVLATTAGVLIAAVPWGLVAGVLALVAPFAVVRTLAERRSRAFNSQLPGVLKIVASSLRSGFSLLQGLASVIDQSENPIRHELQIAMSRIRLGEPIEDALTDTAERTDSRDFEWTVIAIRIQREVGGNLAEILDTVAATMLERERIQREVQTLTAEGRISAIVLSVMPLALGAFIFTVNRPYMNLLFTSFSGRMMLVFSAAMEITGTLWMRRTVRIEV